MQVDKIPYVDQFIKAAQNELSDYLGAQIVITYSIDSLVNTQFIKQQVMQVYDISWDEMLSPARQRNRVNARQVFFWLMRKYTRTTLHDIGQLLNRDHTTVLHGISNIENLLFVKDDVTVNSLNAILNNIKSVENEKV
jgi:chromosomal replication initiation ATPase DnaA